MSVSVDVQDDCYLTRIDVARELKISMKVLRRLIANGELPEGRSYPGVRRRYHREDVMALKRRYETRAATQRVA